MSQWEEVQKLDLRWQEQVSCLYNDSFPMELRERLAAWIEDRDWETASNREPMAAALYSSLLEEVQKHGSHQHSLLVRHSLKKITQQLQEKYDTSPLHMASVIASCLREERRIIAEASELEQGPQEISMQSSVVSERRKYMDTQVEVTWSMVQTLGHMVKQVEDLQEDFDLRYKRLSDISQDPAQMNNVFVKMEGLQVQNMLNELDLKRKEILSKMAEVIKDIYALVTSELPSELREWKRRQQVACIGGPSLIQLDQLQNWFTLTAKSLFQIKRHLDKLGLLVSKVTYEDDPIAQQRPQMEDQVNSVISHLIKSAFVVEHQPYMPTLAPRPSILKTSSQFSTKVRLLVKLPEVDYQLRVKILFDKDLPPGQVNRQFRISSNNTKVMEVESPSGCLSAEFKRLEVKERKSTSGTSRNQSSIPVTEEFHSVCYQAQFCLQGLTISLEVTSLPLVVISNAIQMPGAWASVMWYNMLTDEPENLSFFSSCQSVSWTQLSEVLSWQFSTSLGRGLNGEQLSMLGDKLLGPQASNKDAQVTWSMFCKENLPGKPFTFWTWLDSILDLVRKHLQALWLDGCIMGFVSKERERALLMGREIGTFLLRFSENHLGGITFTWVEGNEGNPRLHSVKPYTKSCLSALPFTNILRKYTLITNGVLTGNPLKFLYPHTPIADAFRDHGNTPQSKEVMGYIQADLWSISMVSTSRCPRSPSPELCVLSPASLDIMAQSFSPDLQITFSDLWSGNEMSFHQPLPE